MTALTFRDVTFNVRTICNTTYITSAQLAQALGYSRPEAVTKIYNRNKDEFTQEMSLTQFGQGGQLPTRLFSLRGAHLAAMFSRTPVAKEFRKWVLDVLDRETGTNEKIEQRLIKQYDYRYGRKSIDTIKEWARSSLSGHAREDMLGICDDLEKVLLHSWTEMDEAILYLSCARAMLLRWRGLK